MQCELEGTELSSLGGSGVEHLSGGGVTRLDVGKQSLGVNGLNRRVTGSKCL